MTPTARLKAALKAQPRSVLDAIASTGIAPRLIRRAVLGQTVNASTHLRLCAAVGLDPASGKPINILLRGDLHYASLSAALRMKRFAEGLSLRIAAERSGMTYTTIGRIERGELVSIDAILAACKWLGRHPFDFVSPWVSREASPRLEHRWDTARV